MVAWRRAGWSPDVWEAFAEELGILGAPFSEEQGGLGGGADREHDRHGRVRQGLVVEPYLATVVIGGGFLKHAGGARADGVIARIIAGDADLRLRLCRAAGPLRPRRPDDHGEEGRRRLRAERPQGRRHRRALGHAT